MRPILWAPLMTLALFASFACRAPEGSEGGDCHASQSCNRDPYCDGDDLVCSGTTCVRAPPRPPAPPVPECTSVDAGACAGDRFADEAIACTGGGTPYTSEFRQCSLARDSDGTQTYCCKTTEVCRQVDVTGCFDAGIGYQCGRDGSPPRALRCERFKTLGDESHSFCCIDGDGCFRYASQDSYACDPHDAQYRCFGDAAPPVDAGCEAGIVPPVLDGSVTPDVLCCPRRAP